MSVQIPMTTPTHTTPARPAPTCSEFGAYVVEDSGESYESAVRRVNERNYCGYSADTRYGGPGKIIVGSLHDYRRLLEGLRSIDGVEFVSHLRLIGEPLPADRVRVAIRHDIDSDLVGGLHQARIESELGIEASWYVLHTAPYYGEFHRGRFRRHDCMGRIYREMQELGHEVALHTDPLWVYQSQRIDGAAAVRTEIEWLRSIGIDIRGTVAHNSKPVYGAWNYEVFRGRYDPNESRSPAEIPDVVERDGVVAPLRTLDERELGLVYEGNEAIRPGAIPHEYGATRGVDRWRWVAHERAMRSGKVRSEGRLDAAFLDQERVIQACRAVPKGMAIILVVHPCYYGGRSEIEADPPIRELRLSRAPSPRLGFEAWRPGAMQSSTSPDGARQEFQTFNMPNELGMLDDPLDAADPGSPDPEIALLGGQELDGVCVPSRVQAVGRLRELWRERGGLVRILKIASAGVSPDRLVQAWLGVSDGRATRSVVLGVGGPEDESGLRRALQRLREARATPMLLLEAKVDARAEERLRAIAAAEAVELIDPRERFAQAEAEGLPTHYAAPAVWNTTGHRIVGDLLAERLFALHPHDPSAPAARPPVAPSAAPTSPPVRATARITSLLRRIVSRWGKR